MTIRHPFSTRKGRKVREAFRRAHLLCEPCQLKGLVVEMAEVHHIKPISEGGAPYDPANMESRCGDCHKRAHGARPRVRTDPKTGLPIGGGHWWSE